MVAYENEKLRTGWAEILLLAERLKPEPALIPARAEDRATMFGLSHEICGEMGFGWAYRLLMIQQSLDHGGETGFPVERGELPGAEVRLQSDPHAGREDARDRYSRMLSERIAGRRYLLGDVVDRARHLLGDVCESDHAAAGERMLPAMPMIRAAYTCHDADILGAVSDELRALQQRIYETHLELPVPL